MWSLQWNLKSQWTQHRGNLSDSIQVSEKTAKDLQWWLLDHNWTSGRPLSMPNPELMVVMDASLLGWGGHLGEVEIRELWSPAKTHFHINVLELWVIHLKQKAFLLSII